MRVTSGDLFSESQHPLQVRQGRQAQIESRLDEGAHIGQNVAPLQRSQALANQLPPVRFGEFSSRSVCLRQGMVEQNQVCRRPGWVAQIPEQVVNIAAFGVRRCKMEYSLPESSEALS